MNIFSEICSGKEYKDNFFFQEWHKAIIRDFETFKTILSSYHESSAKKILVDVICDIQKNIMNSFDSQDEIILKSTPNYFLFSFYYKNDEIPTHVLLSKDYKRILMAYEKMEWFDVDDDYDQDERYGIYGFSIFQMENNQVFHSVEEIEEGTDWYYDQFLPYVDLNINIDMVEYVEMKFADLLKCESSKVKQIKM